tara:strand:+ start:3771 stop:4007 length:237 start_codon:yes stop_codon:yes gene_type:complete
MDPLLIGIILIFGLGMIAGWYLSNMINGSRYESLLKNSAVMMTATREVWERIIKAKRIEQHGIQKKDVQQDSEKDTSK